MRNRIINMFFSEYCRYYVENILSLQKWSSQKTTRSRINTLTKYLGDLELPLSPTEVQKVVTWLSRDRKPQTVRNLVTVLKTIMIAAKNEGIIDTVPNPSMPRIETDEQPWFLPEQLIPLSRYDYMYAVLAETGMRAGEVLALRAGDVDFDKRTLRIEQNIYDGVITTPKSKAGRRTLSISSWLVHILDRQCLNHSATDLVFPKADGSPQEYNRALERFNKDCRRLGLPEYGFHSIRRACATLMASILGMPEKLIAYRMGHGNLGLTLGRYAKYLVGMDREWAEEIGKYLQGKRRTTCSSS